MIKILEEKIGKNNIPEDTYQVILRKLDIGEFEKCAILDKFLSTAYIMADISVKSEYMLLKKIAESIYLTSQYQGKTVLNYESNHVGDVEEQGRIENIKDAIVTTLGKETKFDISKNTFNISKILTGTEITGILKNSYDLFKKYREEENENITITTKIIAWYRDVPESIANSNSLPDLKDEDDHDKIEKKRTTSEYYDYLDEIRHENCSADIEMYIA